MTFRPAQDNGALLRRSAERWEGRVDARSSMHDLLFARPGSVYPFGQSVRVAWRDGVYEFRLETRVGLVTADRCHEPNSDAAFDAFLVQLIGGEP